MSDYKIVSRYAKSIIEISQDKNLLTSTIDDAKYFKEICKVREFRSMLNNPIIKPDTKIKVFDKLFKDNVNDFFYKFMILVIKKNRENTLPDIADEILDIYKRMMQITNVELTTAKELSSEFIVKLKNDLLKSDITEKSIDLKTRVDEKIIGGFILKVYDKLIDSSVLAKLKKMESEIIEKGYERVI